MLAVLREQPLEEVARAFGVERTTIYRWVKRYRAEGESGFARKAVAGRPRKLSGLDSDAFLNIITQPASCFGFETDLWTTERVRQVIETEHGVAISNDTIWRRLREARLTYQKPERRYFEVDEEKRKEWVRKEVPRIRRTLKRHKALLYFQDEASVALRAILGKTWAPRGHTPKVTVTGKRGSVPVQSAINQRGSLVFSIHEGRIASPQIIEFLTQLLRHHPRKHLVVIMDQAPPHTSKKTKAFIEGQPRLHVFHLPAYSPDWNPDEKVWNYLKNHELKAHRAKTVPEMKELTRQKLSDMAANPRLLRGLFYRCCIAPLFT